MHPDRHRTSTTVGTSSSSVVPVTTATRRPPWRTSAVPMASRRPRCSTVVCWIWMVREEGNGATEGRVCGGWVGAGVLVDAEVALVVSRCAGRGGVDRVTEVQRAEWSGRQEQDRGTRKRTLN